MWGSVVSRLVSRAAGPQSLQNFGTSYMRETTAEFCTVIKLDATKNFCKVCHGTRDQFAVTNLLVLELLRITVNRSAQLQ